MTVTNTSTGDIDLDELLGLTALPVPAWPPREFTPASWDHPTSAWAHELLQFGKQLAPDIVHFPAILAIQEIHHCGVAHRVVLVGVRMTTRLERSPM